MGVGNAPSLEDTMSTSVDSTHVQVGSPSVTAVAVLGSVVDVPGLLADRIGDLYASEERRRRNLRTERMILKAQSIK
jgi:hypothetical protein